MEDVASALQSHSREIHIKMYKKLPHHMGEWSENFIKRSELSHGEAFETFKEIWQLAAEAFIF